MRPATRMARDQHTRGFEYIAVAVVVLILALVALPSYRSSVKNSQVAEATARIGEILTAAKAYALSNPGDLGEPTWPRATGGGLVYLHDTKHFRYEITAGTGCDATTTPLTIKARGVDGTKMAGVTVSMTVSNIRSTSMRPVVRGL